jgi:hypothetical protein
VPHLPDSVAQEAYSHEGFERRLLAVEETNRSMAWCFAYAYPARKDLRRRR